jgi:signal transduction histidine kinase
MVVFGAPPRLRTRLFVSYVAVVAAGALAMLAVGTVVTQAVFERRIGRFGLGRGQGRSSSVTESQLREALTDSLVPSLLVGVVAALVAAAILAALVGRRMLRPLDDLGAATRRMVQGDYSVQVPVPAEIELAALAHDVNELGSHLAAVEQRRSRLLGEVTHELRTPITVIRGQMEGLIDGVVDASPDVYAAIADEASRLQRLVDDLTLLSRADEGSIEVHLRDLDLGVLAVAAADRLRPQFEFADVSLIVEDADRAAPLLVRGDPDRLTQVLSNLLGNALAHTPPGGSVTVRSGRAGAMVVVDVVDAGDGISADELGRIFERFYSSPRSAASARRERPGRGLGLTIARSLARAHGGDVIASSAGPGRGATFRVTVPAAE